MRVHVVIFMLLIGAGTLNAQRCIGKKDLVFDLSAGGALQKLNMDTLRTVEDYTIQPNFGFSFAYGLSNRFSLGFMYDRTDASSNYFFDRGRVTSYSLQASFRPYISKRNYLEAHAGYGSGITAFRQTGRGFYSRGTGGLVRAGLSFVRFFSDGFGMKVKMSGFVHNASDIRNPDDDQEWNRGPDEFALTSTVRSLSLGFLVKY